jgi:hypothetical protein
MAQVNMLIAQNRRIESLNMQNARQNWVLTRSSQIAVLRGEHINANAKGFHERFGCQNRLERQPYSSLLEASIQMIDQRKKF